MAVKQKKRETTKQMLKDRGVYEYLAMDNETVFTFRALAENEREYMLEQIFWATKQLNKAHEDSDQELFIKAHRKIAGIVIDLSPDKEKAKVIRSWGVYRYITDLFMLMTRIAEVEGALKSGKEAPEQDLSLHLVTEGEAATANQQQLEKTGESSPAD